MEDLLLGTAVLECSDTVRVEHEKGAQERTRGAIEYRGGRGHEV